MAQENANGEVLWALTDNQGSVRVLLDNDGNVVNNITYDAFGNITVESNPDVNFRFGYTGREFDSETGLYNYRSRYYDPGVGRFISEDPIGFEAGDSNVYRYVGNNPLFYVDPSGFCGVAASGEPEFFGPGSSSGSSSGGSDIGSGLDFFGLGDFAGFAPGGSGGSGGPGVTPFPGDKTIKVAGALESQLLDLGPVTNDNNGDSYPDYYEPKLIGDFGAAAGLGIGFGVYKTFSSQTDDGSTKITTDVRDIFGGLKDLWNGLFNPNNINFDTYEPKVDPFNVETFPGKNYSDDFSNRDIFTFPDGGKTSIRDYTETFPRGIDHWLESPFFESSSDGGSVKIYSPTPKHEPGGWGTEMDLDSKTAERVLNEGSTVPNKKQVYGYHDGKIYEFQPDNAGTFHGYPIPGNEAPASFLKDLKNIATI